MGCEALWALFRSLLCETQGYALIPTLGWFVVVQPNCFEFLRVVLINLFFLRGFLGISQEIQYRFCLYFRPKHYFFKVSKWRKTKDISRNLICFALMIGPWLDTNFHVLSLNLLIVLLFISGNDPWTQTSVNLHPAVMCWVF